ncbi:MAG: 23S rRNA (guanosine(2251)-2'-O)-methyltransferase RlmB [Catenisphaera adipataccumulans]|jgi:23S rRNA (guanosine2251-2'-O)-methyltransferase|uniref:23S rRNA (guanosine(2251)-2'-O)-methyltransferase RlmB n=1 Tax=Catenisphaera adipataccumulans TaxID=700500 RepID=UPI003D9288BA
MKVYGKNVWKHLKQDPDRIKRIYLQDSLKDKRILNEVKNGQFSCRIVSRSELDRMTNHANHQGIVCEVKDIQTYSPDQLLQKAKTPGLLVALDGVQDPHNVGAVLRTCDCTGADGLILTKHNSAGLTPTVIKTSTGAAYSVPVSIVTNLSQTLKELKKAGYWIVGTDMEQARDYREGIYDVPLVLVIGSEGKGISPLVKKQCDYMVKLPMAGSIQSLNASVACGVVLYEIYSKRNPV